VLLLVYPDADDDLEAVDVVALDHHGLLPRDGVQGREDDVLPEIPVVLDEGPAVAELDRDTVAVARLRSDLVRVQVE